MPNQKIEDFIRSLSDDEKILVFRKLRPDVILHPLEAKLGVNAEVILEAISRASELTVRMIRGVIAEAAFKIHVVDPIGLVEIPLHGDLPYDYKLKHNGIETTIQVKLQRSEKHQPKIITSKGQYQGWYAVETQRTRNDLQGGSNRRYGLDEFDVIAVCMQPSTNSWSTFKYTRIENLLKHRNHENSLEIMQPVPPGNTDHWTDNIQEVLNK